MIPRMRERRRQISCGGSPVKEDDEEIFTIDPEIAHLTKLGSEPSENTRKAAYSRLKLPIPAIRMISGRESNRSGGGRFSRADRSYVLGRCLPVYGPWLVDRMDSRAYVSQFSADGSLFVAGFQGSRIKIYDVDNGWKVRKDIIAKSLRWTITDTSLSPDQRHLVYASMSPIIHIVNVGSSSTESHANITDIHDGLDLSVHDNSRYSFGIFSVKFSTDGRELVAGSNDDSIYVYDLEADKVTSRFPAHTSDVNTVTFADETGHVIYSGSDDTLCKVWDRRCIIAEGKPAGVLTGHLEGITFIDSRGDGRYFISNGKDQTTKLWDIRRMTPKASCTGQRYIYTGSKDKCVYIYDVVTGAEVARLPCHRSTVRDCSWHPYYPMLVSSSWDCTIARWEFSGNDADPALVKKKRQQRHAVDS